jgi:hypothetical protein
MFSLIASGKTESSDHRQKCLYFAESNAGAATPVWHSPEIKKPASFRI